MGWVVVTKKPKADHPDLPPLAEAVKERDDGAVYETKDGKQFRLKHARWSPITKRGGAKKKTATKK